MDISEASKRLNSVNWNFDYSISYSNNVLHPLNCRKYYSYPATFIPEIPYALIEILSQKGDCVLDPYGGIGTTFMQALSLERFPFSFDINPVASSVCKTLYMLCDPEIDKDVIQNKLMTLCDEYNETVDYTAQLSEQRKELGGWYEKNTFNELAYLFAKHDRLDDLCLKDSMTLVISSILVSLSCQNKGWAYIADNVKPKEEEKRKKHVFEVYKSSVKVLTNDIKRHQENLPVHSYAQFYKETQKEKRIYDEPFIASKIKENSVDLIITSPPYPRMIDYVKSQRLSFEFLNDDYKNYASSESGARYRRTRKDALSTYESEIMSVNEQLIKSLKAKGFLCVVLPDYDSDDDRREVIGRIVDEYTNKYALQKVFEVSRYIPSHKRTLSIQWATLVNERIFVFQKG